VPALTVEVGERALTIADVVEVARNRAPVRLAASVAPRLQRARAVVETFAAGDRAVYGLNTGLGAAVDTALARDDLAKFQHRALMARAVGVGDFLSAEDVRATLFVRLAGIARGASGLSPALAEVIAAMIEKGVHPRVRQIGTLGEADLAPLAQLFLPLAGAGEAELGGKILGGAEALRQAGIAPPPLESKDAIALINANAFSVAAAALTHHDAALALEALTAAGALSFEAFRANLSPLDPRLSALRPAPGQVDGSRRLLRLLDGSDLLQGGRARRVQDPLSFRCLAPVIGAAFDQLARAAGAIEADLNGAGDSPAVLVDDGEMLSSVNFDTTALALAFEGLGLALAHAAATTVFRISKLMSPQFSELPRFLTPHGGSRTGFATVQKTASALEAEIRHLSLPLGPMTAPVADGTEDYAPMTPRVIEKTRAIVYRLTRLAAVELVVAAQAVDLRGDCKLGVGTHRVHAFVRDHVPALDEDRPTGAEFERLAQTIAAGDLRRALAVTP
jgi:histidine ammonia-lyase